MEIKVGDKVEFDGKSGIVVTNRKENDSLKIVKVSFDGEIKLVSLDVLKLVEIASYVSVPKFRIGDIVYYELPYNKGYILKGIVVTERSDNMNYLIADIENKAWEQYRAGQTMVAIKENELSKEAPKENNDEHK